MTKLTITEAVKRSGVSRPTFNSRYVKTGLIEVFTETRKHYVKATDLTKVLAQAKKKIPAKSTAKPNPTTKAKQTAKATEPKTPIKKTVVTRAKPKTNPPKPTELAKLKLQVKHLRAELKATSEEKESLQRKNESLHRTIRNLTRRLDVAPVKTQPKAKPNGQAKPIPIVLTLPDLPELDVKPRETPRPKQKRERDTTENEKWVDKWWDSF